MTRQVGFPLKPGHFLASFSVERREYAGLWIARRFGCPDLNGKPSSDTDHGGLLCNRESDASWFSVGSVGRLEQTNPLNGYNREGF